jgi:hypothetical protein
MPPARKREPAIPARVKAAIEYMLNTRSDLAEAATHAGLSTYELRRQLGKTHVLKYARAEKKAALEALCLTTPAALNEVLRGENEMAKVAAIKTAEALKEGAVELEQARSALLACKLSSSSGAASSASPISRCRRCRCSMPCRRPRPSRFRPSTTVIPVTDLFLGCE